MILLEFTDCAIEKKLNIGHLINLTGKPIGVKQRSRFREDTASPSLPRVRGKPVQLHPWRLGSAASSTFATIGFSISDINNREQTGFLHWI